MGNDTLWQRLRGWITPDPGHGTAAPSPRDGAGSTRVADSLRNLLDDPTIPASVRSELAADFGRIETMLARDAFQVGVLHGTTTDAEQATLDEARHDGLVLIDTPGINELDGEARERLAFDVAEVSDLVIFVCDGDLTREELDALKTLAATQRPLLLALNKADRYSADEQADLLAQ